MGRGRRSSGNGFDLSDQAQQLLQDREYPARVRQALRLAAHGGRQQSRRCLVCRRQGVHCHAWIPDRAMTVLPDLSARPLVYWLCSKHHGQVDDETIRQQLYPGMPPPAVPDGLHQGDAAARPGAAPE